MTTTAPPTSSTSPTNPTPGDVTIRRAGVQDAGTVLALMHELAEHEDSAGAVRCTEDDWRRMLANRSVLVLLAHLDDHPVGYVSGVRQLNLWIGGDLLAMDDLYVRPGARSSGVGGRLMAALAEAVTSERLVITWGAREDNEAGHRFYRRIGASLRTKVVASWSPHQYAAYLDARPTDRATR
ncbi:Ribosomal protein S18 acetylase RimI [Nocardioides terrae]|uniref:Ribosomal protein S18 acetylase RimI n=1 Tax=Nocardioides terrae TaxID=574651 RepID=A0A1I1NTP1_9ACTN|nr:GNAT family N-acetyltransferase [Nocardioides terrae]SFD00795.1 Ribosomal protein S18 acetylase RimI [Nocardioides terrae]